MSTNPFINILRPYFDWFSKEFENLANEAVKNNVEADDIARDFLANSKLRENFQKYFLPELESKLFDFWSQNSEIILSEIAKLPGIKARFGGDLGPQRRQKLFERLGCYYDTTLVADPVLRSITMEGPHKWRDYYVLKYSITQVLNRDVYLADVYPPIAVLFGEEHLLKQTSHYPLLRNQSMFDAIAVTNSIFAKDFDTEEDALKFFQKVGTSKALAKEVVNTDMFILDDEVGNSPLEQIEAYEKEKGINLDVNKLPEIMRGANSIWIAIFGRMLQANELLQGATEMEAHPVIQAPCSFHWLTTKVRVNSEIMSKAIEENLFLQLPLTNALLSQNLDWLGNVPLNDLIRLRKQGFLSELRTIIAINFSELSKVTLSNFDRVSQEVDYNLQIAFNRHQEQIKTLNQTLLKDLSISIPTLLISVGAVAQPLFGTMLPSWLPLAAAIGGGTSLKNIVSDTAKHFAERKKLAKSPIGILWNTRNLS